MLRPIGFSLLFTALLLATTSGSASIAASPRAPSALVTIDFEDAAAPVKIPPDYYADLGVEITAPGDRFLWVAAQRPAYPTNTPVNFIYGFYHELYNSRKYYPVQVRFVSSGTSTERKVRHVSFYTTRVQPNYQEDVSPRWIAEVFDAQGRSLDRKSGNGHNEHVIFERDAAEIVRLVFTPESVVPHPGVSIDLGFGFDTLSFTAVPDAPSSVSATAVSASVVQVAWQAGGTAASGYQVERRDPGEGSFREVASVSGVTFEYSDPDLLPASSYQYRVRTVSDGSFSAYAYAESVTTKTAPPSDLIATAVSASRIDLSWHDQSRNEMDFRVERGTGTDPFVEIAAVDAGMTSYSDLGLEARTRYFYRVRASSEIGFSDYSTPDSASTDQGEIEATPLYPADRALVSPATRFGVKVGDGDAPEGVEVEITIDGREPRRFAGTFQVGETARLACEPDETGPARVLTPGWHIWQARIVLPGGPCDWSAERSFLVYGGIDVSGLIPPESWSRIKVGGWSFAIVDSWGGLGQRLFPAGANLTQAHTHGLRTAIYCVLNFNDRAKRGVGGEKPPKVQDGGWQVRQALLAAGGTERPNGRWRLPVPVYFVAVDVESFYKNGRSSHLSDEFHYGKTRLTPRERKERTKAQEAAVHRIQEAVDAVSVAGFVPIIYTKNSYREGRRRGQPLDNQWSLITGNSTAFSKLPLWVSRAGSDDVPRRDDLALDIREPWQPFGGWPLRQGKQYAIEVKGRFGNRTLEIDLNTFAPALFGERYPDP
jgi:hypothetical protein